MWSLALSGSTLTLGGEFTRVLSVSSTPATRNRVAAIDTGTHTVTPWNPTIGDGSVYAVASDSEAVHVGGPFTQVNGQVVSGFTTLAQ